MICQARRGGVGEGSMAVQFVHEVLETPRQEMTRREVRLDQAEDPFCIVGDALAQEWQFR